jgi:hypothetical protein
MPRTPQGFGKILQRALLKGRAIICEILQTLKQGFRAQHNKASYWIHFNCRRGIKETQTASFLLLFFVPKPANCPQHRNDAHKPASRFNIRQKKQRGENLKHIGALRSQLSSAPNLRRQRHLSKSSPVENSFTNVKSLTTRY